MKRKELKFAACVLVGIMAVSGGDFSTHATQVTTVLPVAGVGLKLEEGTSVDELEQIVLGVENGNGENNTENIDIDVAAVTGQETVLTDDMIADGSDTFDSAVDAENAGGEEAAESLDNTDEADTSQEEESQNVDETEELEEGYGDLVIAQVRDWVNVRSGPSTDAEIVGKLYNNSVGEMIRVEGDWYYITSGTVTGYVKAEYCVTGAEADAMVDEVSVKTATVNTVTLNLRATPSTDAVLLKQLAGGTVLDVTSTDFDGWVEVNVGGTIGYVSAEYVNVNIEFVSAESKEEEEARLARERAEEEARRAAEAAAATTQTTQTVTEIPPEDTTPIVVSSGNGTGTEVANFALQFVGNPYVYGGTSLTNGADCSGFVLAVYAQFGVSLPHSATADRSMGIAVASLAEAQPGDLVCYSGHVGIYIGNGQIVHASTPSSGIKISDANYKPIVCIRRIFY